MSEAWQKDFPVASEEESYVARREFTKFLALTSIAFFIGTFTATARKIWKRAIWKAPDAVRITNVDDVAIGGYKLFRYPTESDPCILVRLDQDRFAAFDQRCTHLSCPVYFNGKDRQLLCPCHNGIFSAADGSVLAGPPKRALDALMVSIRNGEVWVQSMEVENL
jgi:arsenite oxidase small subunit